MWSDLGLDTILDQLARPDRREVVRLSDRAVTVGGTAINFITAPTASSAVSILAASGCRRYLLAAFPHFKPLQRYNRCAARVTRTFPERYMASV
jgi:hypothetical protein